MEPDRHPRQAGRHHGKESRLGRHGMDHVGTFFPEQADQTPQGGDILERGDPPLHRDGGGTDALPAGDFVQQRAR